MISPPIVIVGRSFTARQRKAIKADRPSAEVSHGIKVQRPRASTLAEQARRRARKAQRRARKAGR